MNPRSLKEIQAELDRLKKEYSKTASEVLEEGFKDIFAKYPEVETISWEQYTPFFNDGDVCEFGINSDVEINGKSEWELEEGAETSPAYQEASDLLTSIDEDVFEHIYGDHVKVTIHRNGKSEVDEYEHE
jgi:hypothetical protein